MSGWLDLQYLKKYGYITVDRRQNRKDTRIVIS
jgi:hypothetical protein